METHDPIIHKSFKDLAPMILRKRLVVEALTHREMISSDIRSYLIALSRRMNMTIVSMPQIQHEEAYGYSGYLCWKESGCHMYSWKQTEDRPHFVSIDIYTCKDFVIDDVIQFTRLHFKDGLQELTWRT